MIVGSPWHGERNAHPRVIQGTLLRVSVPVLPPVSGSMILRVVQTTAMMKRTIPYPMERWAIVVEVYQRIRRAHQRATWGLWRRGPGIAALIKMV